MRKLHGLVGILAVTFGVVAASVNIYHWWDIGWDAVSYHWLVPWAGLGMWGMILLSYWWYKVKSLGLWAVGVFYIIYDFILLLMVQGVI